jgi:ribosomal protein S19E (S16A)
MLSTAEIQTLKAVNDRESCERVSRTHLEKLARLDLIEPCDEGVCVTGQGQRFLRK